MDSTSSKDAFRKCAGEVLDKRDVLVERGHARAAPTAVSRIGKMEYTLSGHSDRL